MVFIFKLLLINLSYIGIGLININSIMDLTGDVIGRIGGATTTTKANGSRKIHNTAGRKPGRPISTPANDDESLLNVNKLRII